MPTNPKELPTLRDSKDPRQVDMFQRDVREIIRRLREDMEAADAVTAEELAAAIAELEASIGSVVSGVSSVTSSDSALVISPTTGAVVASINESALSGIPESAVTGLVADLAARPTGSGTGGRSTRWTGASTLGNGAFTDDGTNVSTDGTLTLTSMTPGSVLFAGTGGVVSQDNTNLFWDDTNNRLGVKTNAPVKPLHVVGDACVTGSSSVLTVGTTGITMPLFVATTEFSKDGDFNSSIVSVYSSLNAAHCGEHMSFRGRGTASAPAAVQSGDYLGQFAFTGATSATTHFSGALMRAAATEGWTNPTNVGTKLEFLTTTNASTGTGRAVRMTIDHNGATTVTGTAAGDTITSNNTGTGLTGNVALFAGTNSTTLNTTGGALTSYAYYGDAASTRSAGANSLTNVGIRLRARNGQVNRAIWAQEGDVLLNDTSGITRIGASFTPDANAQLHVRVASSGATAAASGSTIVAEQNGVSYITIKGPASTAKGVLFSNPTAANDGGVIYDDAAFARGLQLRAAGVNIITASSAGAITVGSATTQAHTVSGSIAQTYTGSSPTVALASTYSGTAQTGDRFTTQFTNSGTYDCTAATREAYGLRCSVTATRSAGANTLGNNAAYFTASGAQVNNALRTNDGDVLLNQSSGTTAFRTSASTIAALNISANTLQYGINATQSSTGRIVETRGINISTTGSSDATAAGRQNYGGVFSVTSTRSAGANNVTNYGLFVDSTGGTNNIGIYQDRGDNTFNATSGSTVFNGAMSVLGNAQLGNSTTADTHSITGATTVASGALSTLSTAYSGTGITGDRSSVAVTNTGTFDATAAGRVAYGVNAAVTATRSAGANNLTNVGLYGTASGGQVNRALQTDAGDVLLNNTGGTTTISGATTLSSTLDVTGTTTLKGTAVICDGTGDTLKFYGGTGATQQTITGSRGGNAALADLLTKLATLGLIVDGTSA